MTSCKQSRKEAATLTTLLTTRKNLNIGTWNIRTMFESGKTAQVAREMYNYNLVLLGLCETRWKQSGQLRLTTGKMVLYSGHEESSAPHTEGVALLLVKEAQKALIGWEARGPRFITAFFSTVRKNIRMNVVQCYAPTNDESEEVKDEFYRQLQGILSRLSDQDVNILMGDFNAKLGSDNTGYDEVMGRHGLGELNENGERFADACALNNMVIDGSVFPHKRIHMQGNMGVPGAYNREPDRPRLNYKEVQKITKRCPGQERSRCCIGSSSGNGQTKGMKQVKKEEEHDIM